MHAQIKRGSNQQVVLFDFVNKSRTLLRVSEGPILDTSDCLLFLKT